MSSHHCPHVAMEVVEALVGRVSCPSYETVKPGIKARPVDIIVPSSNTCPVLPGIVGVFQAAVSETLVIM